MNQKSLDDLNLKTFSTLQTHEITNHKLQKTKLFSLYYICSCVSYFHTKKRKQNILHKHSQNKHLYIYTFLILFYFHTICRFGFRKNTNVDNIYKVI